jgi:hypothetical protein
MAYFGVDETIRIEEICMGFRNYCRAKTSGFNGLRNALLEADVNQTGGLSVVEFEQALAAYG